MRALKLPADTRPLALGLLLLVVVLVYLLGVHWWFVAPQRAIAGEMAELREQQQRFAAIIAEQPEIEKRLAAVRKYEADNQAFLQESDPAGASASLSQRVGEIIKKHDPEGNRCSSQQSTMLRNQGREEPYESVGVRVRLSCDTEMLVAVLHDLEDGKPFLFIDELSLYQRGSNYRNRRQVENSRLDVQLTVTGYLRRPGSST